jgi:hypothetical protein
MNFYKADKLHHAHSFLIWNSTEIILGERSGRIWRPAEANNGQRISKYASIPTLYVNPLTGGLILNEKQSLTDAFS